jgi:hypothetical protein
MRAVVKVPSGCLVAAAAATAAPDLSSLDGVRRANLTDAAEKYAFALGLASIDPDLRDPARLQELVCRETGAGGLQAEPRE